MVKWVQWSICAIGAVLALGGCSGASSTEPRDEGRTGTVLQASGSDGISANPNPCVPSGSSPLCTANISWTLADNATHAYQAVVRVDNGPYQLFACIAPGDPMPGASAPWIFPHKKYVFSLRKKLTSTCGTLDPSFAEVASTVVEATTSRIWANGNLDVVRVPVAPQTTTPVTLSFIGAYAGTNNQVWVSDSDAAPTKIGCVASGTGTSMLTYSVLGNHSYRFTVNPTPNACSSTTRYPETASVIVKADSHYITGTPSPCSATPGGNCTTKLSWGTSSTGVQPKIWQVEGTVKTALPCPPTSPSVNATIIDGKTYRYELHLVPSCSAPYGTSQRKATTTVSGLSGVVAHVGSQMLLGGNRYQSIGMTGAELFLRYLRDPPLTSRLSCSAMTTTPIEAPGTCCADQPSGVCPGKQAVSGQCSAEKTIYDAASKGIKYIRLPIYNEPEDLDVWLQCQSPVLFKFNQLVTYARSQGVKLVVQLLGDLCRFADPHGESLSTMLMNPSSTSAQAAASLVNTVVSTYPLETAILAWDLLGEGNLLADLDPSVVHCATPGSGISSEVLVKYVRDLAIAVKLVDPNHSISTGAGAIHNHAHLHAFPGWGPSPGGPCTENGAGMEQRWCPDDQNMFESHLRLINPDPVDLVSLHFGNPRSFSETLGGVPASGADRENELFGSKGRYTADVLAAYKAAADRSGQALFAADVVGCSGDVVGDSCDVAFESTRNFNRSAVQRVVDLQIPLSTHWLWEWRFGTSVHDIEPNPVGGDDFITVVQEMNAVLGSTTNAIHATPSNPGFENYGTGGAIPDSWTKGGTGAVNHVTDIFNGTAVDLSGVVTLTSTAVALGAALPPTAKLVGSVAIKTPPSFTGFAWLQVLAFTNDTGTGNPALTLTVPAAGHVGTWEVFSGYSSLPSTIRSVAARLNISTGTGTHVLADDVHVSVSY